MTVSRFFYLWLVCLCPPQSPLQEPPEGLGGVFGEKQNPLRLYRNREGNTPTKWHFHFKRRLLRL